MPRKKTRFDVGKEIRSIARERVGPVPAERVIVPKTARKKPKHKKKIENEAE
jgi:stress response protein YsnF